MKTFEKKYNEALGWIRKVYPTLTGADKEDAEHYFPELKESEDERIRKNCIHFLGLQKAHHADTSEIDECISYLEKQKESQPLMCDGEIEDKKRDIVAAIRKYYPADYAEYLTSFLKGLSPEDNSEDEYGQEMLGIAYKLMYEHIPKNLRTQEFWDSLKFMREYTGKVAIIHPYEQQPAKQLGGTFTSYDMAKTFTEGQNYVIAHPEKFGLCKPAEWGEGDAGMLNCIIATLCEESHGGREANEKMVTWLENRLKFLRPQPKQEWSEEDEYVINKVLNWAEIVNPTSSIFEKLPKEKFIERLKSLRPQSNWKPTKRQIDALNSIILIGSFTYVGQTQDLIALKDELKELM